MTHTKETLWTEMKYCLFWLTLAILILLAAVLCPLMPAEESRSSWFQRSGSIVVVLSIWVQFKLLSIQTYLDQDAYNIPIEVPGWYFGAYQYISRITVIVMLCGTIIWGYGDIILKYITCT